MIRRVFPWLSVAAMIVLLLAGAPMPGVQAQTPPTVDGRIYGDGDIAHYQLVATSPPLVPGGRERGWVYQYWDEATDWVYIAFVEDRSVNDNVFGDTTLDYDYLISAGWTVRGGKLHPFYDLYDSDHAEFEIRCGDSVYHWAQDYLYDQDGDLIPETDDIWLSDVNGPDAFLEGSTGPQTPPPGLVSASSMQWNMNNTAWDYTLGGARGSYQTWKSPDTEPLNDVTDEIGYPPLGTQPDDNITYEPVVGWEWPIVYEFKFDWQTACNDATITFEVIYSHNSKSKDGTDAVPTAVELLWFEALKETPKGITLGWETDSETDNMGFNLYRVGADGGEWTRINNDGLIPSLSPGGSVGARYEYTDTAVDKKTSYYYWLEDVDVQGKTGLHGPLEASTGKLPKK